MTLQASRWPDDDARRGWAARTAVTEDAHWIADVVLSAQDSGEPRAYPALLLGHHFVRIVYEGATAIRSANTHVGWPTLADLISDQFADITARARHVSKLLDDTAKAYEDVLADLDRVYRHNHATLTGNTHSWLRWLETDMGVYSIGDRIVGASIPMAYRLALDPADQGAMAGEGLADVTREWGGTVAVLQAATLSEPLVEAGSLDLTDRRIGYRDCLAARYLKNRYEPEFPLALKLLILMIEGDLNTNIVYLPLTEAGHENATFRARVVSAYHSLTSLDQVSERSRSLGSPGLRELRSILADPPTRRLLSRGGKQVRNRCVHYEIKNRSISLDPSRPMHGIVEAVNPETTFGEFDVLVQDVTRRLADFLGTWQPRHPSTSS